MDDIPICPDWWPKMLWKIHFPHPRPGPNPGPINYPPAIDHIMAALTMHSLSYMLMDRSAAENVRAVTEATIASTARELSKLHAASVGAATRKAMKAPTDQEIEAMAQFPSSGGECEVLCDDYWQAVERLEDATGPEKQRLIARIRLLKRRMDELHCPLCVPQ